MDNTKNIFIVFGGEHYNPLGAVRSIGESGNAPVAIILRSSQRITSMSKYISKLYMVDSIDEGYSILLNEYGNQSRKPIIITCDDTISSYLDCHYDELKDKFIFFNANKAGMITKYMNKYEQVKLAEKCNIQVLWSEIVDKGVIPEKIEYPVITKAIDSTEQGWKNNVFICNTEKELKIAYEKMSCEKILLQKYLNKKNELCLDGFSINHGEKVFISMGSNYKYLLPNSYSFYMNLFSFHDTELKNKIDKMFKEIGYEGIFTIEFLEDNDGKMYFCEINFRNSGWSYASTCLGMNLPVLWVKCVSHKDIPSEINKPIKKGSTAMVELSDFRIRVKSGKISPKNWMKEFRRSDCTFLYNKKDMKPFWAVINLIIQRKLKKH